MPWVATESVRSKSKPLSGQSLRNCLPEVTKNSSRSHRSPRQKRFVFTPWADHIYRHQIWCSYDTNGRAKGSTDAFRVSTANLDKDMIVSCRIYWGSRGLSCSISSLCHAASNVFAEEGTGEDIRHKMWRYLSRVAKRCASTNSQAPWPRGTRQRKPGKFLSSKLSLL